MRFTDDQKKAIEAQDRNILVAAAAGSGKTRVLVERIIRQILEDGMDVDKLLVVTFTHAAAEEMRERIEDALAREMDDSIDQDAAARLDRQMILLTGADISTFHSFCQRVIRQHIETIDVDPKFRLAGKQEMTLLKQDVLEAMLEEKYERPERAEEFPAWETFLSFMDDYGDEKGDEKIKAAILKLYTFAQSQPFPEKWLQSQQERKAETLADSLWLGEILPEMKNALLSVMGQYEELTVLGRSREDAAFTAAWEPYGDLIQQDLAGLDAIRDAFHVLAMSPDAEKWNAFTDQLRQLSLGELRKKIYNDLKVLYPDVRQAFDERRKAVKAVLTKFKETYMKQTAAQMEAEVADNQRVVAVYAQLALDFGRALQAAKKERNVLDFNDLEHYALQILSCEDEDGKVVPSEAAQALREKYQSIMVDEYQDTNGVQETILNLIAREDNRFIVGDVKQSIYRFRLADPTLFQAKYDSFVKEPAAEDKNQLITMKKNFRSRAEVLAPINFLFDQIMTREAADIEYDQDNKLYPGAYYPDHEHTLAGPMELDLILQEQPDLKEQKKMPADTESEDEAEEDLQGFKLETQYIAQRITRLMEERPVVFDKDKNGYRPIDFRDIVVLLRAASGKANILLETLRKNSIPAYADVDGGYFEAAEVRLMLALLKVLDNVRQDIPLAAVLASPIGGFSMEELTQIRLAAETGDLYDGLLASFSVDSRLPQELAARTAAFQAELARWRKFAVSHSVPELIWLLYRDTGYYDYAGGLKGGLLRQANLRMLADRAAEYERTNYRGLFRFLRFIENLQKRETDLSVARTLGASENVVQIMTIHHSKGLEFPVVIVADTAKAFNFKDLNDSFQMHKDLGIGVKIAKRSKVGRQIYRSLPWRAVCTKIRANAKAEEMRILYVAMTRAREKLILTGLVKGKSLTKMFQNYCRYVEQQEVQLPTFAITGAKSYLDWVIPALSRHSDGAPLRKEAGLEDVTANLEQKIEPDARIQVNLCPATEITADKQVEDTTDELLRAAGCFQPLPESPDKERVEQMLDWHYEDKGLTSVPAKLTVTEIKRRFAAVPERDDELPMAQQLIVLNEQEELEAVTSAGESSAAVAEKTTAELEADWPRPRFMREQQTKLSPMERGTIMHAAMQRLDFHGDVSYQGLKKQIEALEARGILPEGASKVVYIKGIQGFFDSPLGAKVQNARRIYRELPFSRMLRAKDFYPEVQEDSERVFTQGVIDLLVETAEGELILIDYKTDRLTNPDRIRRRYQIQLDLYRRAVEAILGRKVDKSYLYLLQNGSFVPMDTAG